MQGKMHREKDEGGRGWSRNWEPVDSIAIFATGFLKIRDHYTG